VVAANGASVVDIFESIDAQRNQAATPAQRE